MKFVFDLDDVLVESCVVSIASAQLYDEGKLNKLYTYKDINDFEFSNLPKVLVDRIYFLFNDIKFAVWSKKPIKGAYNFLLLLKKLNHNVIVLTSRPITLKDDSEKYLNKYFPNVIDDFLMADTSTCGYNGNGHPKKESLKKLKPDFFFDDCQYHVKDSIDLNINTYMIRNKYTTYNHKFTYLNLKTLTNIAFFPIKNY